jgi:hypothetical protein
MVLGISIDQSFCLMQSCLYWTVQAYGIDTPALRHPENQEPLQKIGFEEMERIL